MTAREVVVAAAQMGPIRLDESRKEVVERQIELLQRARQFGAELVVFPELALTTFFPRWYEQDLAQADHFYETAMPSAEVQPLFDEAARLGVGFALGYAERIVDEAGDTAHRYNTMALVERNGSIVGKYRKVHVPGHENDEPNRPFQHAERRYFEVGPDPWAVWRCFGGVVGMMLCNDRRWPETYRVMALQGVELILCGYNTPIHYVPDPDQDSLAGFHNSLVMQAGAYQNGTWVVGTAKGGVEEGVDSLAESQIIAPSGQIVAKSQTRGDEVITAVVNLDRCRNYTETLFDFDHYRMPEHYGLIVERRGAIPPPEE